MPCYGRPGRVPARCQRRERTRRQHEMRLPTSLQDPGDAPFEGANDPTDLVDPPVAEELASRRARTDAVIASAMALLAGAPDAEQVLAEIVRLLAPALVDWCTVELVEPNGSIWRVGQADASNDLIFANDLPGAAPPPPMPA